MATYTTTLGLVKPDNDEHYNINLWNENMDKIDANMNVSLERIIVESLPTEDIRTNAIYLVLDTTQEMTVYNEYMYIQSAWSLIGTTATNNPDDAGIVGFNNTGTDLDSTNAQDAIVEVNAKIPLPSTKGDIQYNRTTDEIQCFNGTEWELWEGGILRSLILINNGVEQDTFSDYVYGSPTHSHEIIGGYSVITCSNSGGHYSRYIQVDLTNYYTLKVLAHSTRTTSDTTNKTEKIIINDTADITTPVSSVQVYGTSDNTFTLDVSSLTGNYYILCDTNNAYQQTSKLSIKKLWLE